jgi:hypothetical protein
MAEKKIGNKNRKEWIAVLESIKRAAVTHLNLIELAERHKKPEFKKMLKEDYDALLDAYILVEFVIEHFDWGDQESSVDRIHRDKNTTTILQ